MEPISLRNFSRGIILGSAVDEYSVPQGSVSYAVNVQFDSIGSLKVRLGVTILGAQLVSAHAIVGLHQFLDTAGGTDDRLIAVCNTVAYYLSAGTWTSKRATLTADAPADFTNFVDQVFMVNDNEATAVWNGGSATSFVTTGNALSAPIGKYVENFRSRVWIMNTANGASRIEYSSVADTSSVILWSGDDFGYIDIAPGDGEDIMGGIKFANALLVFKKNFLYKIYSVNETDPDPQIFVGTYSHKSIELAKDGVYWHHPSGFYRMRRGEQPMEISKPIYDLISNISRSYYGNISSWHDDDHVYFSVGDVTVEGESVTNCVARWTISTEVWTIYSYAMEFRAGANYDNGTNLLRVVGDDDGKVYTFNLGNTDNGSAIHYRVDTSWYNISGLRSNLKVLRKLTALHEDMVGAQFGWKNGTMSFNEIQPIGELQNQESVFDNQDIQGNRIKFSISGSSSVQSGTFQGIEILEWLKEEV